MKALLNAIRTKFTENTTLYNSVGGRMYFGDAPQNAALPYIVYNLISNPLQRTFDIKYPIFRIQFDIYSDQTSGIEAQNIYAYLEQVYGDDNLSLTMSGFNFKRMDRENTVIDKIPASETGNKNLWDITIDYMVQLEVL